MILPDPFLPRQHLHEQGLAVCERGRRESQDMLTFTRSILLAWLKKHGTSPKKVERQQRSLTSDTNTENCTIKLPMTYMKAIQKRDKDADNVKAKQTMFAISVMFHFTTNVLLNTIAESEFLHASSCLCL